MPQVFYDTSLPEPNDTAGELKANAPDVQPTKTPSFRMIWMTIIIIVMLVIAVGVGVGVGIWRSHKHSSRMSPVNRYRASWHRTFEDLLVHSYKLPELLHLQETNWEQV